MPGWEDRAKAAEDELARIDETTRAAIPGVKNLVDRSAMLARHYRNTFWGDQARGAEAKLARVAKLIERLNRAHATGGPFTYSTGRASGKHWAASRLREILEGKG